MQVNKLFLDGFRNYENFEASFSDRVNIIVGNNAQGKTNLLEAIYYLAAGRSFRAVKGDKELIAFHRDDAVLSAVVISSGREQTLQAHLSRVRRRRLYANDVKLKSAAELSGRLTAVLFCPDDIDIIRGGPALRRRLLDGCLCQLRPRYATALAEYNRLLEHKTRVLRDYRDKPALLGTLEDFNQRLAETGAELIAVRAAYVNILSRIAARVHGEVSDGAETLTVSYKTVKTIENPHQKPAALIPRLLEHQKSHLRAELETGLCLSGPHKDDLEICIGGVPARAFASQGQARTAALSLKLAEREIHYEDRGEYPVLLLDDVLSELDEKRRNFVLNHIDKGQVFITCCSALDISAATGGRILRIEAGRLAETL